MCVKFRDNNKIYCKSNFPALPCQLTHRRDKAVTQQRDMRIAYRLQVDGLSLASAYILYTLSLPVQCAYAGKLNCPKFNNAHGRVTQERALFRLSIVLQHF